MKKWLLVLGMITCMIGLTACGQVEEKETPLMSQEEAETMGAQIVETINQYAVLDAKDQATDPLLISAIEGWESAAEDMGNYEEVISTETQFEGDDGVVSVRVKGSLREAIVEIVVDKGVITSVSTNVEYTFGEQMGKAALNTLLGMGTVFVVLILISFIISLFVYIPKIQDKFTKKSKKNQQAPAPVQAAKPAAPAVEEEPADDLELVAVIAAAIAASEGASSTDGFVVRSIRRAGRRQRTV